MLNVISSVNFICASIGMLFGVALLFRVKQDRSNLFLALAFIIISYFRLISFSVVDFSAQFKVVLMYLGVIMAPVDILYPVLVYFFILSVTRKWRPVSPWRALHFLPFVFFLVYYHSTKEITPDTLLFTSPDLPAMRFFEHNFRNFLYLESINFLGLIYAGYSLWLFSRFQRSLHHRVSTINKGKRTWIYIFLIFLIVNNVFRNIGMLSHTLNLTSYEFYISMRALGDLSFDVIIVSTVFMSFVDPEAIYDLKIAEFTPDSDPPAEQSGPPKYENAHLKPELCDEIERRLMKYMNRDKPYLKNELTINQLAKELNVSMHQLSYVINSRLNQNFHTFINKYRVEETMRRIEEMVASGKEDNLLNIAIDSGFNSKTGFNTCFKKQTGMTPSEFKQKNIQERDRT